MSNQIFKTTPSIKILIKFLDELTTFQNNKYILSKMLFKKAQLTEKIEPFIEKIKPHYFKSKVFYAERKINYKNFVTIVRQMCKAYAIGFVSSIKYCKSKYDIEYNIFMPKKLIDI